MRFDTHRFLTEKFGDPANVVATLQRHGLESPSFYAVEKWFQRKRVPGESLLILVHIAEQETRDSVLSRYMTRNGGKD